MELFLKSRTIVLMHLLVWVCLFIFLVFLLALLIFIFFETVSRFKISLLGDAPYVPTEKDVILKALSAANLSEKDVFMDLGSGDGRILLAALNDFHVKKAIGIENNFYQNMKSRLRLLFSSHPFNCWEVRKKNFLRADLKNCDVVYMYLHPKVIKNSLEKKLQEMPKGSTLISHRFKLPFKDPTKLIKQENAYPIYIYSF